MDGDKKDQLQIDFDFLDELIHSQAPKHVEGETIPKQGDPSSLGGRISFFSSSQGSIIRDAQIANLAVDADTRHELYKLLNADSGFWWLDVSTPTRGEVYDICKAFGIHPLTAEDITTQEAGEKIEIFPSYYFACFRSFQTVQEDDGVEYVPFNVYVIVLRTGALSFSLTPNSHASRVHARIATARDFIGLNSDWICYALIDEIVDSFVPPIHQLERDVDTIEDEVFVIRDADTRPFFQSMERARKSSTALLRLLGDKANVIRRLTKRYNEESMTVPSPEIALNLDDVQDHVLTMSANLVHFEKILARANANYLATLRINKLTQDTKTNRFLGKITLVAGVGIPLQLISMMWGMNIKVPAKETDSLGPFFGILGFIFVVCSSMLFFARRKKYV